MPDNISHLLFTAIFTIPLFLILWGLYGRFLIKKKSIIIKTTLFVTFYLTIFYQFTIPLDCWYYPEGKNFGRFLGHMPIEDLALFSSISLIISSATLIFAKLEESGRSLI